MSRDTTVADTKAKCPVFKGDRCPFTGLKSELAKSPVFDHGCIVSPGQCETIGEVTDVLASLVPNDEQGKKVMAHAIQQAVVLSYNEEKKLGKSCQAHHTWPFNTDKDGNPVFEPQSAIDSVYVTMDTIKTKCPVFEGGKACPYNVPALKGLGNGCPEFKDGCPFKGVKDVGEFRQKLGKMRDKMPEGKGLVNSNKALEIIHNANEELVAKYGHCPFFTYGCQVKEDLKGQPITDDFVELEYVKEKCPAFQHGRRCPYDMACLKGLGKGCPSFKDGCPFKDVKTIGEFKAKLGQMRDQCKGIANHCKALEMIHAASGAEVPKYGHCPFFKYGCPLSTDETGKPIAPETVTMTYVKEHCPAFGKGKNCPFNVQELKGLGERCPAFKNGCPFKSVKNVGEFKTMLGEMRDTCKGKANYRKALEIIQGANGQQVAKLGHCPFFKFECPFKTDRENKPILSESVSMDYIKSHCPTFAKGTACPYASKALKGLAKGCPEFKKSGGCPFKDVKDVGEFKAKLGEMREMHDNCKGKESCTKALELVYAANGEAVAKHGHCPFFKGGCILKSDLNGKYVTPETVTMTYVKEHCPAFDKGKSCPYNVQELKGLGKRCPTFKDGCPFKSVKNVGEFKTMLGEMRDTCKGKANYRKALEIIHKASVDEAAKIGHCPFHHKHCELKIDLPGKPVV